MSKHESWKHADDKAFRGSLDLPDEIITTLRSFACGEMPAASWTHMLATQPKLASVRDGEGHTFLSEFVGDPRARGTARRISEAHRRVCDFLLAHDVVVTPSPRYEKEAAADERAVAEVPKLAPALLDTLHAFVAGNLSSNEWMSWLREHRDCFAGVLTRRELAEFGASRRKEVAPKADEVALAHVRVCQLLLAHDPSLTPSERYDQEATAAENARLEQEEREEADRERRVRQRRDEHATRIDRLGAAFPKFARALKRKAHAIEYFHADVSEADVDATERGLGVCLTTEYRSFLSCCRCLDLGGTIRFDEPFEPGQWTGIKRLPAPHMVIIAEFWKDADGDQLVLALPGKPCAEAPVYYYAHAWPKLVKFAPSFTHLLEKKLSRTELFREL